MISKGAFFRLLDATLLSAVFLFQAITLNLYIIKRFRSSPFVFLCFLLDFFTLLIFSWTLFLAYRNKYKRKKKAERSLNNSITSSISSNNSISSSRPNSCNSNESERALYSPGHCFSQISTLPFIYISWLFYAFVLIAKIIVLFKSEVPQKLGQEGEGFFGVQFFKLSIGVSAFILTLLVEFHQESGDELQRSYIRFCSSSLALEIFDTTSFLSILIPSESHLIYPYALENFILCLSSLNLLLPAVALYKLSITGFGKSYDLPIEFLYKVLHLVCVNVPYMGFRIYLWGFYETNVSVFIIKNVYAIVAFVREVIPEVLKLRQYYIERNKQIPKLIPSEAMPMELTKNGTLKAHNGKDNV